tara:strand:+ start:2439 stop:2999 length:561 start_codon:yes stop_codon:yes gene_type:complete
MENTFLPETYLIGLIGLLSVISILVGRQLLKVRRDEINLIKLEKAKAISSREASKLYELASVQLRKRLYPQATTTLKDALTKLENEPSEAKAVIENAMGFALAAQDQFKKATVHYLNALKAKPDYPVALNNLAYAKNQLQEVEEAKQLYEKVITLEPGNKTAIRQLKKLNLLKGVKVVSKDERKGF